MIIVSQDKTEIVIKAHSVNGNDFKYILARYKTEERAKEVLQKIIELCKNQVNKYHYSNVLNVYEMPKE